MQANMIQQQVQEYLQQQGIEISFRLIGEVVKDNWVCDQWQYLIVKGKNNYSGMYYTGTGLRKLKKGASMAPKCGRSTIAYVEWKKNNLVATTPHTADLLYSMLLDSQAADQSFNDWCNECGYENDSMKAFGIYQECCKTAEGIRKVLSRDDLDVVGNLLAEY